MSYRAAALGLFVSICTQSANATPPPGEPPPMLADADPANDLVVAPPEPLANCEERLAAAGVEFTAASLPLRPKRAGRPTCGVEQAVVYRRGPAKVRFSPPPVVSCLMALGLARFEQLLVEEAERHWGQPVVRVEQGGTYNCRKMARFDLVSEHAYANAIDIRAVTLKNGRKISVLGGFGRLDAARLRPEAEFWRTVARRAYDEGAFSVVITPFFDRLHRDHLHLDQARYRVDGSRPSG